MGVLIKEIKIHTWFEFHKLMEKMDFDERVRWADGQKPTDYLPCEKPISIEFYLEENSQIRIVYNS